MPTITSVSTNAKEYSRYSQYDINGIDLSKIEYRITTTGTDSSMSVQVDLVQEVNLEIVATKITAASSSFISNISLKNDCYDINYLNPESPYPKKKIYRARHGWYYLRVSIIDGMGTELDAVESERFAILIVTYAELRRRHAFGFPALANDIFMPVMQPKLVTGVTVKFISDDTPLGNYRLYWNSSTHQLQLAHAQMRPDAPTPHVTIDITKDDSYILPLPNEGDYVLANVKALLLPGSPVDEELIFDRQRIDETAWTEYLIEASGYIENRLMTSIEPTRYASDYELDEFLHEMGPPVTFYPQQTRTAIMKVSIPKTPLIAVTHIQGMYNADRAFEVPEPWKTFNPKSGLVQFFPRRGALTTWLFQNANLLQFTYGGRNMVPQFWHYAATVGLDDLFDKYAIVREMVIKRAMVNILTVIGSAYRGGVSSESVSKEGVSTSIGYTSSASLNVYGADITLYQADLDAQLPLLKQRIKGLPMIVLN